MIRPFGMKTILMMALFATVTKGLGVWKYDTGKGILYGLKVVKDVALERSNSNFNWLQYLMVSKHPQYNNKRSLVQFQSLPSSCPVSKIKSAKMYLYYVHSHKASWHSIRYSPFIPRYMHVHLVKKYWSESQATTSKRYSGANWSTHWLGLDDTDAEAIPQDWNPVTIFPVRPRGFVEFDITPAVIKWRSGVPNHGLVIRATNELELGRDVRFYSNAYGDSSKHAFVHVFCAP